MGVARERQSPQRPLVRVRRFSTRSCASAGVTATSTVRPAASGVIVNDRVLKAYSSASGLTL
ncbi:hypothetical protein D3C81_1790040 [compost metagenome]